MRGHGDSGWSPDAAYLVEDHVKDLTALIQALGLKRVSLWGNSTGGRVVQVYAGLNPGMVERVISEDVGPERPQDISDGFAKRVAREANGWASEDELVKELMKRAPRTPEAIVRNFARYGTKRRDDGRIVWKRDPNTAKGFVVTELWQYVSKYHVANHLCARRREPDRSTRYATEAEGDPTQWRGRGNARARPLSQ